MCRDLLGSRELAWRLMARDLSARYRQSLLGFIWAFATPIFMVAALTLAVDAKLVNAGNTSLPYPAFVLLGMVLWQTFTDALNAPAQAMIGAKTFLARLKFPHEALILAKLGEAAFDFMIKLALLAGVFLWFGVPVAWPAFVLAPLALMALVLLGLFIGLLLLPLALLIEDVSRGLGLATAIWFWFTPVAYEAPGDGLFALIVRLNPVTPLLSTARDLVAGRAASFVLEFWIVSAVAALGTLVAWAGFRLAMPFVIERIGH
ncbi:MAG: ABC transporter permease [Elusimicrobia bacterium]|nr:ABC transporter permease [Elusimicrobiota bacterium]